MLNAKILARANMNTVLDITRFKAEMAWPCGKTSRF